MLGSAADTDAAGSCLELDDRNEVRVFIDRILHEPILEPIPKHGIHTHEWFMQANVEFMSGRLFETKDLPVYKQMPDDISLQKIHHVKDDCVSRLFISPNEKKCPNSDLTQLPFQKRFRDPKELPRSDLGLKPQLEGGPKWWAKDGRRILYKLEGHPHSFATVWYKGSTWRKGKARDEREKLGTLPKFTVWRFGVEIVDQHGVKQEIPQLNFLEYWHLHAVLPTDEKLETSSTLGDVLTLPRQTNPVPRRRQQEYEILDKCFVQLDSIDSTLRQAHMQLARGSSEQSSCEPARPAPSSESARALGTEGSHRLYPSPWTASGVKRKRKDSS